MEEKTVAGLDEAQWKERYIAYMKAHSDALDWQCDESADVAWELSTDETPEECAEGDMSCWD